MSKLDWNVRAPEQPGGIDLLTLVVRDFRGRAVNATPADLTACLQANPEACAEVLAGMGPTHFAARDAEWWHDRFVAEKARAEQAEHSLAASERALAALRYQAQAGGCELSTVGENSYHCRTDALCGLCRLRHRAERAERDLSELHTRITDLVATWGPPTHDPDACPSVAAGVGPCFRCAVSAAVARATQAERDRDACKLAEAVAEACGLAADDITHVVSAAANTLRRLVRERDEAMTLAEERRDYARAQNARLSVDCDYLRARVAKLAKVVEAARVLAQKYAGHSASCVVVGPPGGKATILREPTAESCTCRPDAKAFYDALRALDSPVGVAATADPEPPPDYLTRAELVAAVRSAASAVGGPTRRALDALADALEIPRT